MLQPLPEIDADRWSEDYRMLDSQWQEYKAKLERIEADITRAQADVRTNREMVSTLERTVPIPESGLGRSRACTSKR